MKFAPLALMATLVAGCVVGGDDPLVGETSGNENELAVNEIVNQGETLIVTASGLNLRNGASTSATILGVLPQGSRVTVTETSGSNGWVAVERSSGVRGHVFGRYVVREDASGATP